MTKTAEINASGLAPVQVTVPRFTPVEPVVFAKKREAARRALAELQPPSDKKYTNWLRLGIPEHFLQKPLGGFDPKLTIDQADYDTGIRTMAIPLAKAIGDWPDQVEQYLMGPALPAEAHYFSALSGATYRTGAAVVVPKGVKADITADLLAESGKLNAYRTVVVIGEGAVANYIERSGELTAAGQLDTIVSHGIEVYLAEGAKLNFYALQRWPRSVTSLSIYRARLAKDAQLNWLVGSFGSRFSQVVVESELAGVGAESNVQAVYYGNGNQHFEQSLIANHAVGKTTSDTYARGVVTDTAKNVYRGLIKIQPGAHGSSADQNGHAMLLGNDAHVDAIPGLEIDADDVTAGHGATVGQIDPEQLFYLMARGLPEEQARQTIIRGFFEDLFSKIESDSARREFQRAVEARLA